MREYETTFLVQPEISSEGIEAICGRLDGILEKQGADRLLYDDMGRRRLAYEIRKFQKGHYLTLIYLDEGQAVPEVERALRIDDAVLRYLTVVVNERVQDVEARKSAAAELEQERARKAAERAVREAEDAAREAEEAAKAEASRLEEAAKAEAIRAEEAAKAEASRAEEAAKAEAGGDEETAKAEASEVEVVEEPAAEAPSDGDADAEGEKKEG